MSFRLANLDGQSVPRTVEKAYASGSDFLAGALLVVDGNGDFAECGADPASVAAVAASGGGTDTSVFNRVGSRGFPPGYVQGHAVQGEQPFHAEYTGTLPAAAGGSYGVVKDSDDKWKVDFSETVNTRVKLLSIDWTASPLNKNRVLVSFLPSVVQTI